MKKHFLLILGNLLILVFLSQAQSFNLQIDIKNQPLDVVVLGMVRGDNFIASDSIALYNENTGSNYSKTMNWTFPADASRGIYRVVFGQTTYARVMNEPPQRLDFIFNEEDIHFKTDFEAPADSLKVIHSKENLVWYAFLKKEREYRQKLNELEMEVNYYQNKLNEVSSKSNAEERTNIEEKAAKVANEFNQLQMEKEMFIVQTINENENLFVAGLVNETREPFRDGYLTEEERNQSFRKEYLRYINFSDEAFMHSSVLTDKIFNYLITFNKPGYSQEQRENAYIEAVDAVLQKVESDAGRGGEMYEFVLSYLVDGFEGLKMEKVLDWISDHHSESVCKTEEKTTLRRKLESRKMTVGSQAPDFTMNDLSGRQVVFSQMLKNHNLLIFWASWCPHCTAIMPHIVLLCSKISTMQVIAVSLDNSADEWNKAVYKLGTQEFVNLSDFMKWEGPVAEDYNVYATPTMFLMDNNRKILAKPSSLQELSAALEKYCFQ